MTITGLSLMLERMEKKTSKSVVSDLITFLRASYPDNGSNKPRWGKNQPSDLGTLPGLVEPDN